MTRQKFIKIMNNAINRCIIFSDGGYTCNTLSIEETGIHCTPTKLREEYSRTFNFGEKTVTCLLYGDYTRIDKEFVKIVRLSCLELFKAITLESKGYKKL